MYVASGYVASGYVQEGLIIDWLTKIIKVPVQFLTPISTGVYQMNVNDFRLALKDIEDNYDGIVQEDTHRHNTEVTLSGVTYARTVEIINNYKVEFEVNVPIYGYYSVLLVGANHNIADVKVPSLVSIVTNNSAGLVNQGNLSALQAQQLEELWKIHGLKAGAPLTVSDAARAADDISQTITDNGTTTTVTRV
jgi:hypothetical protein